MSAGKEKTGKVHVLVTRLTVRRARDQLRRWSVAVLLAGGLGLSLVLFSTSRLVHASCGVVLGPDMYGRSYVVVRQDPTEQELALERAIRAHLRVHELHDDPSSEMSHHSSLRHVFDSEEAEAMRVGYAEAVRNGALDTWSRIAWWLRGRPEYVTPVTVLLCFAVWFFRWGLRWASRDPVLAENPELRELIDG